MSVDKFLSFAEALLTQSSTLRMTDYDGFTYALGTSSPALDDDKEDRCRAPEELGIFVLCH